MVNTIHCPAGGQDVPCPPGQKNPPAHKAGPGGDRICYGPRRGQTGGLPRSEKGQGPGTRRGKKPTIRRRLSVSLMQVKK